MAVANPKRESMRADRGTGRRNLPALPAMLALLCAAMLALGIAASRASTASAASAAAPRMSEVMTKGDASVYLSDWIEIENATDGGIDLSGCALVTESDMERANPDKAVGLVFTDIYDPWEVDLKTGFTNGVKAVDPDIEIINSIIGDWVDPQKGASVTRALIAQGVDVVYYTTGAYFYGNVGTRASAPAKKKLEWVVKAPAGTKLTVKAVSQKAGQAELSVELC